MSDLYNENDPLQDDVNNEQKNTAPNDNEEYRTPPYMRESGEYDPSAYDDENRYRSRVPEGNGKKKKNGKIAAAVVIAALAIGGTVGAACWGLGGKLGSTASVNRGAVIETAAPEALVQEKLASQAAEEETVKSEAAEETTQLQQTVSEEAEETKGQQAVSEEAEEKSAPAAPAAAQNRGPSGSGQGMAAMGTQETVTESMMAGVTETMSVLAASETQSQEETEGQPAETAGEEPEAAEEAADAEYQTEEAEEAEEAEPQDEAAEEPPVERGAAGAEELSEDAEEAAELETQIGTAQLDTTKATAVKALDVTEVVEVAMPSVVAITTTAVYESYYNNNMDPFYYFFYGYGGGYGNGNQGGSNQYQVTGAGSGIIIGDDGNELWIVTNNHVVEDAETLSVNFVDDSNVAGYVMGTDAKNDLALVGVKLSDLSDETKQAIKAVKMGDSDSLKLGETVIAIGNALGLGQSVSTGVVSAVNREITTSEGTKLTTIQTDAAINPGNSGGALLDASGELIGINVAKDAETEVEGMGYAIPISSAKAIIERLTTMSGREPVSEEDYPFMGVQLQDISSDVAKVYRMPEGILVYGMEEDGPARKAGMLEQDIITGFNGIPVSTYEELTDELQYYAGGTEVTVTVQRLENGAYSEKELNMTLGFRKDYQTASQQAQEKEQNSGEQDKEQQPGQKQPGNGNGSGSGNGSWGGFNFGN